ncbi:hypothetical protein ACN47E_007544 [Coniothyrium glycines]
MAEYSKQTVAQLRQLLKDRSIPSTGLTRKAQIIERLEEVDGAIGSAPDAASENDDSEDAPQDAVEQVEEGIEQQHGGATAVLGPTLSEAGESEAQLTGETDPVPLPVAATDTKQGQVSHIDNEIPPPNTAKAIEGSAEDATTEEEVDTIQPAAVFGAPPADPEEVVGPRVTEPSDAEVEDDTKETLAPDALPDAPGPAAEALRYAKHKSDLPGDLKDTAMSSPAATERSSVEKPELLTNLEGSTADTSRLNTEELEADSRKRKRRSDTPEVPGDDIKAKKQRPSQTIAPAVYLKEDEDIAMEQRRPGEGPQDKPNGELALPAAKDLSVTEGENKREKKENTARYRDLLDAPVAETITEAIMDDRPTVPALHPVTAALYIRNFMRPLRPEPLRAHLASLASPLSSSPDQSFVKSLFLDAMKTHALVLFSSTTAASRVRASLHGSIWPPEGNRKELWVDFVPDDRVEDWIKEEEDAAAAEKEARGSSRSAAPKRFEVVYPESSDGSVTAVFQEVGSNAPANAPRGPRVNADVRRPSASQAPVPAAPSKDIEASFKTLDDLFSSTAAKPQLFFLPVSDDISEARLKALDRETSRDWAPGEVRKGRGIKTELKYKYSFDEEDRVVETGEDRGPWSETYRGGRGGFRGRGRGSGTFRGRGGDTWRG